MKILYQCESFLPDTIGGVETLSAQFVEGLQARGHEVLVVSTRIGNGASGLHSYRGMRILKLDFGGALDCKDLRRIRALTEEVHAALQQFQPEVVHLNDIRPSSFFFLHRGPKTDLPFLLALHAPIELLPANGIQTRLMQQAHRLVAVSHALRRDAVAFDPAVEPRIEVIHNALLEPAVEPRPLPDPPLLLCLGRLVQDKGFDLAVRAFAGVYTQRPQVRLLIAGDGHERPRLEQMVEDAGVGDAVSFTGWVAPEAVPQLLNQATLLLMPSRWAEPFGLVALEAAQMARPVIVSDRGGLPEVVQHGVSGLVVAAEDSAALQGAIEQLLDDPRRTAQMGRDAQARARQLFDFESMLLGYERGYRAARDAHAAGAGRDATSS